MACGISVWLVYSLIPPITGEGLEELGDVLFRQLPEGPPLYPSDLTTTQTERFFVAEVVREKLLAATRDELPYTTGVVVELFEEEPELLRVEAVIYVERPSQKAIVIGRGGRTIKAIGQAAREELEALLGIRLFLGLRVKVKLVEPRTLKRSQGKAKRVVDMRNI